ncbi:MAG: HEAT repeat domain-containing protein [Labilithrix sp.]|nr:HEAT repeat domain-containing protein [Labilithrix sp.]MCW5812858.1 HEAT repeat domain-containing protein [Labilithrix sp.]
MPRETIRKLSDSTDRLLVAGAHLAPGNADLMRDKEALGKLIAKLGAKSPPVFARLNEQIDAVLDAKPKDQASELISLMTSIASVRAGLAQLAPVPAEDAPLTAVPEVQTPCNARDLYALHDALVMTGQGRMEKVDGAVERGDVADLRLVHAVIQSMGDSYIGDKVSDQVVPKFGRAIVDPIRAKLRFPGKKVDGRRLRALVAVERHGAQPLVEQAVREGSPEMREAALDAIADHMPGVPELEPIALSILEKERAGDVRRAAVRALGGYSSDASLAMLFGALEDERTVRQAAEALGKSKHAKVVDGLIERLQKAAADATARVKKADKAASSRQAMATSQVLAILEALTRHVDKRVPPIARELLEDYPAAAASCLIGQGRLEDLRLVADLLEGKDESLFRVAARAVAKLPPDERFDRFVKLLEAKDRSSKIGKYRVSTVWSCTDEEDELTPLGERWVKKLLALAKEPDAPNGVLTALGRTKDPRAYAPLLARLEKDRATEVVNDAIHGLAALGDKRAIDPILKNVGTNVMYTVRRAVLELADETTVDKVRTIYAALKKPEAYENWPIRSMLQYLERKFPGH